MIKYMLALCLLTPMITHAQQQDLSSVTKNSETVEELIKAAMKARSEGRFLEALSLLREAEKQEPQNLDVQFYIGLTQYTLADIPGAEMTLRALLIKEPKYVDAKIILGRVLIAKGELVESERLLREAIAQTPDYLDAYEALATNLLAQKKINAAIDVLDAGLAQAPGNVDLLVKKGKLLFIQKNHERALDVAEDLINSSQVGAQYEGHVLKAQILFEKNPVSIQEASALLTAAIKLKPTSAEAYLILADIYASSWKFEKAREVLVAAFEQVLNREMIDLKLAEMIRLASEVADFSAAITASNWSFDDNRATWREFYLDASWRIDPYKTLVFGVEYFTRDELSDQTLRVEYVQKLNKWIYAYAQGRYTLNSDFREKNGAKIGANFVTNPLSVGSSVIVAEIENRNYENSKVYFLVAGVDQYIGKSFILTAKIFRVLTEDADFNVWSGKLSWQATEKLQFSAGYGTMTEDVSGRLRKGFSYNGGAQYKINDRFSATGNYTRHSNELYKANQVTVGVKMNLNKPRKK